LARNTIFVQPGGKLHSRKLTESWQAWQLFCKKGKFIAEMRLLLYQMACAACGCMVKTV